MPTFNFTDNDGIDIGNKYVTKEYVMDVYPNLIPSMASPDLWTWGSNTDGSLGIGTTTARSSPGTTVGGGATWTQVVIGGSQNGYTLAGVKSDGTLWTCGYNFKGGLGDGSTTSRSSPGTTAGGGTTWKQVAMQMNGGIFMSAVKTDGTLWTWGYDGYGVLGAGTNNTSRSSPGTTAGGGTNWKQVACGYGAAVGAVKTDGTLWTWGTNGAGQLGDGTTSTRSSPVTTAGGGTNWKQLSMGASFSAAIKNDGTLWTWGSGGGGTLGTNNTTNRSSPGTTSGGGTNWKQVSGGSYHCTAIKTDGTLWTWGTNTNGSLGTGDTTDRSSPGTTVGGGTDWKTLAFNQGTYTTAALKTDGTLWTWGGNAAGTLGTNNTTSRSSPGTTVANFTSWKSVCMAGGFTSKGGAVAIAEQGNW
jgi:alpha-tubulin suppressor-like RCC1 family protein